MNDEEIYDKVNEQIKQNVLECYDCMGVKINLTSKIMHFVGQAISRTLIYKNSREITALTGGKND